MLDSFTKLYNELPKSWHISILLFSSFIFTIIFNLISNQNIEFSKKTIEVLINKSDISGNAYRIAQSIESLEEIGLINCSKIVLNSNQNLEILNNNYRSQCKNEFSLSRLLFFQTKIRTKAGLGLNISSHSSLQLSLKIGLMFTWIGIFIICYLIGLILINNQIRIKETATSKELAAQQIYDITRQVAHDIRAPLTALSVVAKMPDDKFSEAKELIITTSERVKSIADDLLNYSKMKVNEKHNCLNLIDLINKTILEFQIREVAKISFKYEKNRSYLTNIEESLLSRIISNIIQNSVEASTTPNIEINLSIEMCSLNLTLSDNGPGVPQDSLHLLGKHNFTSKGNTGNGLGLKYCNNEINRVGGNISFENAKVGSGFIVKIQLPLAQPPNLS